MKSLSPAIAPLLQTAYEDWFITLYNVLYSTLPILLVGLFDQVSPHCYSSGIQRHLPPGL